MEWMLQPWPWYVSGPLIGLTVPLLLVIVGKPFGVSSSFRHLCSICSPNTTIGYLRENDWRQESWNLLFVFGIVVGSFAGMHLLSNQAIPLLPGHYHQWSGAIFLFVGGLLVGFGTRYADGCTSGHSIMGMSNLKWPSLVATISFFVGGVFMVTMFDLFSIGVTQE
jgi:uncharacterized membrane protein YedE/YeeE